MPQDCLLDGCYLGTILSLSNGSELNIRTISLNQSEMGRFNRAQIDEAGKSIPFGSSTMIYWEWTVKLVLGIHTRRGLMSLFADI